MCDADTLYRFELASGSQTGVRHGFGCSDVAIGQIDTDPQLEIVIAIRPAATSSTAFHFLSSVAISMATALPTSRRVRTTASSFSRARSRHSSATASRPATPSLGAPWRPRRSRTVGDRSPADFAARGAFHSLFGSFLSFVILKRPIVGWLGSAAENCGSRNGAKYVDNLRAVPEPARSRRIDPRSGATPPRGWLVLSAVQEMFQQRFGGLR